MFMSPSNRRSPGAPGAPGAPNVASVAGVAGVLALLGALSFAACDPTGDPIPGVTDGGVAACVPLAPAPRTLPPGARAVVPNELDQQGRILAPAETCDRGEFFIEVAEGAPTPCAEFAGAVEIDLEASLSERLCNYLGSTDEEFDREGHEIEGGAQQRARQGRALDPRRFCATACQNRGNADNSWGKRPDATFNVTLEPVFIPGAESIPLPEGADRRFFRIRLVATANNQETPIIMPDVSVCSYLEDLRVAVDRGLAACAGNMAGGAPAECAVPVAESVRIGRECQSLNTGYAATAEMLGWHLDRLGARTVPEGPAPERGPKVALIDSGVESGLPIARRLLANGAPDGVEPGHPHGSLMAALMLQVWPTADITSIRTLGGGKTPEGFGTTADLARGLWQAISSGATAAELEVPLIVNLSVGWPEVLSRPRRVRGLRRVVDPETGLWGLVDGASVCETIEDGPGEVVRYALSMAYHADRVRGGQPVATFAAAGNRSHALRHEAETTAAALAHVDCGSGDLAARLQDAWCDGAEARPDAPLFLPALWGHEGVRVDPWNPEMCGPPARIVEPIAALDVMDLPAATDPGLEQAPLAAPGQHVYGANRGLTRALVPIGGPCDSAAARARKQPLGLTGTSVSAALVSAVATAVQTRLMGLGREPFSARALSRWLYVTGVGVPAIDGSGGERPSLGGMPVRRPNLCRALGVLAAPCADGVEACVREIPTETAALGGADELSACVAEGERCAAEAVSASDCVDAAVAAPLPLANYPPAPPNGATKCLKNTFSGALDALWVATGAAPYLGTDERAERILTTALAGIVGPQPPIPVCPDCIFTYTATGTGKVTLVVDVNTKLPAGTVISKPRLVVYDTRFSTSTGGTQTLDLTSTAFTMTPALDPSKWTAGTRITISGPAPVGTGKLTTSASEWRSFVKAELLCNVSGSTLITSPVDVSSLRVQAL